jgi:hypothetical protein
MLISEPNARPAPAAAAKPFTVGLHRTLIHIEIITRRRSTSSADDRLGTRELRTDKSRSFFLDHAARLGRAQLASHGQHCPRRDDIASVETELPQLRRGLPALPQQFEQSVGPQSKAHGEFIPLIFA